MPQRWNARRTGAERQALSAGGNLPGFSCSLDKGSSLGARGQETNPPHGFCVRRMKDHDTQLAAIFFVRLARDVRAASSDPLRNSEPG